MFRYLESLYPSTTSWCTPSARPYQRYLEKVFWDSMTLATGSDVTLVFAVMETIDRDTRGGKSFVVEVPSREGTPWLTNFYTTLRVWEVEVLRGDNRISNRRRRSSNASSSIKEGQFNILVHDRNIRGSIMFSIEEK